MLEQAVANVGELLSRSMVENHEAATHQLLAECFDGCGTAFNIAGGKYFAISSELDVALLYEKIGEMYDLGHPLTLAEKRGSEFKCMQQIEIRGDGNSGLTMDVGDLVGPKSKVLELIGNVMVEFYPTLEVFHLVVLDGSGWNHCVGVRETFIRLVWIDVVVDKKRALGIIDLALARLMKTSCVEIRDAEKELYKAVIG